MVSDKKPVMMPFALL